MDNTLSIILIIVSSFFGYLIKTKVDSSCCCCTLKLERDDNTNKLESISVVKKKRNSQNISNINIEHDIGSL